MSDHKELTPVDIKKIEDLASLANDLIEQENFKEVMDDQLFKTRGLVTSCKKTL